MRFWDADISLNWSPLFWVTAALIQLSQCATLTACRLPDLKPAFVPCTSKAQCGPQEVCDPVSRLCELGVQKGHVCTDAWECVTQQCITTAASPEQTVCD